MSMQGEAEEFHISGHCLLLLGTRFQSLGAHELLTCLLTAKVWRVACFTGDSLKQVESFTQRKSVAFYFSITEKIFPDYFNDPFQCNISMTYIVI